MKPFEGYKSQLARRRTRYLPAGPYVARVKAVKITGDEPDQKLVLRLDVCEGEYADYFLNRYKQDDERYRNGGKYEPKYKGDFVLRIPNPDNKAAMYPESDKRTFNDAMAKIEESNPGYTWDWNEAGLAGKLIGINMQERENNGTVFTAIGRLEIVQEVRAGTVEPMQPKGGQNGANSANNAVPEHGHSAPVPVTPPDELPWF